MVNALSLLERWTGKAAFLAEAGVPVDPTGAPLPPAPGTVPVKLPPADVLEARGRALITGNPVAVNALFVSGDGMERSTRPVRILKVVRAWNAYRQMLLFYGVKAIASYLSAYGIHYGYFAAQVPAKVSLGWVNMGGQLVPESKVDGLRASIRTGLIGSWAGIHEQYEIWWQAYPRDRAENAYAALRLVTGLETISPEKWNGLLDEALKIRAYIEEQVYITKKKDYTNAFRGITYRNDAERDAVLGKVEDNAFIKTAARESAAFREMVAAVRA